MKKLLMIVVVLALGWGSQGQTLLTINPSEKLIYVKIVDGIKTFVVINGDNYEEYTLESGECGDISPDGRYLAISSEDVQILKIIYLPTKQEIIHVNWQPHWGSCALYWRENDILSILTNTFPVPTFQISGTSLIDLTLQPTETPIYPSFPYFYPSDDILVLIRQNPVYSNIYLYEQCLGYQAYDLETCPGLGMVIYDMEKETVIEDLEVTNRAYLRGYDVDLYTSNRLIPVSQPLVAWSRDGRYLAYFRRLYDNSIPDEGRITVYDLYSDTYLTDNDALYLPNINRDFQWSSNNILLVWQTRPFMEGYSYHSSLTFFSFFYADTETSVNGDKPFDVLSLHATFAPDGRAIVFIGKALDTFEYPDFGSNPRRGDLIIMSTMTGESIIIDTDVTEIITWRTVIDGE